MFAWNVTASSLERVSIGLIGIVVLLALLWAHLEVPLIATGDGYAVYFPTAWELLDGRGLGALDALNWGYFRMPGYSIALYLAALCVGEVGRAVTVVALTAVAVLFTAIIFPPAQVERPYARVFAAALFCGSPCFLNMSLVSTPDLACLAIQAVALMLVVNGKSFRPLWMAVAGLLSGASILFRFNSIGLLAFILVAVVASKDRANWRLRLALMIAGTLVPLLSWSLVSHVMHHEVFWLPGGPTEVPISVFHREVLPGSNDLWGAYLTNPVTMTGKILKRTLLAGPLEVSRMAAGGYVSLLGVVSLPVLLRGSVRNIVLLLVLVASTWTPMAVSGFEPRYYPFPVAVICFGAGVTLDHVVRLLPLDAKWQRAVVPAIAVGLLGIRAPALEEHLGGQRRGASFLAETALLEQAGAQFRAGCIGTEETAFRLTGFRYLMRLKARDRLCCCGLSADQAGFLRFKGYGSIDHDDLTGFELIEIDGAPNMLELYERVDAGR